MKPKKPTLEDIFIADCNSKFGNLTFEAEMLLRYGYSTGATVASRIAYDDGTEDQRRKVLEALGAASSRTAIVR